LVPNISRHFRVSLSGISPSSFIGDTEGLNVRTTKLSCKRKTPTYFKKLITQTNNKKHTHTHTKIKNWCKLGSIKHHTVW
jgi:hypothetical protein